MKIVLVFLVLACLVPLYSWAEESDISPCEPCERTGERAYEPVDTLVIGGVVGECSVRIVYEKRYCGGCWDIHIRSVEPLAAGCRDFMPKSGPLTEKQEARLDYIITTAIGRMLFNNEMNIPPINPGQIACWRVIKPQCMSYTCYNNLIVAPLAAPPEGDAGPHPQPDSAYIFKACFNDTTRCCMNKMLVQRDECSILRHRDIPLDANLRGANRDFENQYTRPCPYCYIFCLNACDRSLMQTYLYYDMNPWLFWTTPGTQ